MDRTGRRTHLQDLVSLDGVLAVVERTHAGIEEHYPHPDRAEVDGIDCHESVSRAAFKLFLVTGQPPKDAVYLRWSNKEKPELRNPRDLLIIDRELIIGDIVKRRAEDAMSGVVVNATTLCKLTAPRDLTLHDGERLVGNPDALAEPSWSIAGPPHQLVDIPTSELVCPDTFSIDDIILYRNWVGRIHYLEEAYTLKLPSNGVVELNIHASEDIHGPHPDGPDLGDICQTKKGYLRQGQWIYGAYNPNTKPIGTLVRKRPIRIHVDWIRARPVPGGTVGAQPPDELEADEFTSSECRVYDCTRKPAGYIRSPTSTISDSHTEAQLGQRVRFRDMAAACAKYDGTTHHGKIVKRDRAQSLGYDLNVYVVDEFVTEVDVQWQDLSITKHFTIDVEPDEGGLENEHDAWPGEIVQTRDLRRLPHGTHPQGVVESPSRVGVVQEVNNTDRVASVRWCDGELQWLRSDDRDRSFPLVNTVGRAVTEPQQQSLYDLDALADLNVRRGDICIVEQKGQAQPAGEPRDSGNRDWIGQIIDTPLDGTFIIRLGDADEVRDEVFLRHETRIVVRSEGDRYMDTQAEEMDTDSDADSVAESEDYGEDVLATYVDENGDPMDEEDVENEDWESDVDGGSDVVMEDPPEDAMVALETLSTSARSPDPPAVPGAFPAVAAAAAPTAPAAVAVPSTPGTISEPTSPEPYMVLSIEPPPSHAFVSEPSESANATFMRRSAKEHRILAKPGSLPPNVFVRSYESRLDLLRVLIIGPEETPYANTPFIIDLYLPPDFPIGPPRCFFHSFVARGRVGGAYKINPNLYEDGKICLSLLGTWDGDRRESWNPAKSTILQVLVSLLGLVLVKEPYFNEAGFEHLQGLPEYKRSSDLYTEQALIRSAGLLLATLERLSPHSTADNTADMGPGIEGYEGTLRYLYAANWGPRLLRKFINDADAIVEKSERGEGAPPGTPRREGEIAGKVTYITKGACLKLKPAVAGLKTHAQRFIDAQRPRHNPYGASQLA